MRKKLLPVDLSPTHKRPLKTERTSSIVAPPVAQEQRRRFYPHDLESALDEALEESFPASDSPSILLA